MGRSKRDSRLEYRTPRLRLPHRKEPYWTSLEEGQALGYYRPKDGAAGRWVAKVFDVETKARRTYTLATADDHADADGESVLNYGQAQAKARAWIQAAKTLATGEEARKGPYTVAWAMEDYLNDCIRRDVKSVDSMRFSVNAHILPKLGGLEVARLTRSRLERWHQELANQSARLRTKKTAPEPARREAPKTEDEKRQRRASANRILTILKGALNLALHRKLVACSGEAWRELKPFRGSSQPRTRFLSIKEQARLMEACEPEFRLVVQAALLTGARYGEICRMEARDFSSQAGAIHIPFAKGGKPRHVYLTAEGLAFFRQVTQGKEPGDLMFLRSSFQSRDWVRFPDKVQRAWRHTEQYREMKNACEAAGLDYLNFHQLRHSYASTLLNAGIRLDHIAKQLGHTDTRMAERHYAHLAPNAVADSIRNLAPKLGVLQPENVVPLRTAT